tara:strand:+ start:852 stop:2171 length:1320 start_codon:yes stop_codon:yes gene_type:complete
MDDIRSLREQRDELAGKINDVLLRNDSIEDTESIDLLEQGEQKLAELDTQIRAAEVRAKAEERLAKPSFGFTPSTGSAPREDAEYRFEMNGAEIRVVGGNTTAPNGPTTGFGGAYGAAIPVDLTAEMVRRLPVLAPIRGFFNVRSYSNDIELQRVSDRVAMTTTANQIGESGTYPNADMELERIRVHSFKTAAKSNVTEEFLRDARGNAVAELLLQHAEEHGRLWDTLYATGLGRNLGPDPVFLTPAQWSTAYNTATSESTTAADAPHADINTETISASEVGNTAATKSAEIVRALTSARYDVLPAQYWGGGLKWLVTQEFFAQISTAIDAFSRPLFQPLSASTPSSDNAAGTMLGLPVTVTNNITGKADDTEGSSDVGKCVALLAHAEDFQVFDRKGFSQQVDPFSAGDVGQTVYRTRMRSDGRWLRPYAAVQIVVGA